MTILNPTLSRRTFLGGAGASIALAAAQSAASTLVPLPPLPVVAMLCETDGLGPLEVAMASQHLDVRTILLAPPHDFARCRRADGQKLASALHRLLPGRDGKVKVLRLQPEAVRACPLRIEPDLPTLLLGSFSGYWPVSEEAHRADPHPSVTRLLRTSPNVYIDDLDLGDRMSRHPALSSLQRRTVTGLCSSIDPAVDFACSHVRSGEIGQLKFISASLRIQDVANRLEATAIHERFWANPSTNSIIRLHFRGTASIHPRLTLRGSCGHLQIALYTALDRRDTIAGRLQRFTTLARGDSTFANRG